MNLQQKEIICDNNSIKMRRKMMEPEYTSENKCYHQDKRTFYL